jgi:alpha-tubulin suppressor-like RCC1 family protein
MTLGIGGGWTVNGGISIVGYDIPTGYKLWTWGQNNFGALGLGDTNSRSSPTQVGSLTTWSTVTNNFYGGTAVKIDGTLWTWGYNFYGNLGLNDGIDRSSPVQVPGISGWLTSFRSGNVGSDGGVLAIKTNLDNTNGTLLSWGYNQSGQLGLNNITTRSSPIQVGSLTTWSNVSSGESFAAAIKTDGTLWSWGRNTTLAAAAAGQLGQGDTLNRSSPVQVGVLTTWSTVSARRLSCLAIKTDGTLWSWGRNSYGQLGLGDTLNRSSPTQVGSLTTWATVANGYTNSLAIKTDGTLWAWGGGANGQLGQGDTINRSSPVQIGSLTTWSSIACGWYWSAAKNTDGTLWTWGGNGDGQLGLGDTINRSSPIQVGSLTTWVNISLGGDAAYFIAALSS